MRFDYGLVFFFFFEKQLHYAVQVYNLKNFVTDYLFI